MSIYLKETSLVLKILLQRGTYDITTVEDIKNELKVAIPLESLKTIPSSNDKIPYTLVSLINHGFDSLDCGDYVSDVFEANTGIWWHCAHKNITQISDFPKGVYLRDIHKKTQKIKVCQVQQMYYFLFISEQAI